jgi:hypothetical protein
MPVDLEFTRRNGSLRRGRFIVDRRFIVDTGDGGFLMVEPLTRYLGLTPSGPVWLRCEARPEITES